MLHLHLILLVALYVSRSTRQWADLFEGCRCALEFTRTSSLILLAVLATLAVAALMALVEAFVRSGGIRD